MATIEVLLGYTKPSLGGDRAAKQLQVEAIRRFGDGPIDSGKHPTSDDLRRGLVLAHRSFSLRRSCCWSSFLERLVASRILPFDLEQIGWRRFAILQAIAGCVVVGATPQSGFRCRFRRRSMWHVPAASTEARTPVSPVRFQHTRGASPGAGCPDAQFDRRCRRSSLSSATPRSRGPLVQPRQRQPGLDRPFGGNRSRRVLLR